MAEKQLNRMIAQTLERRPRNSKVEKNVSTQREKAERLEIPILPAGRGGEGLRRGGLSASALLSAEARPEPLRRRWWLCLSFALLLSRPRGLLRLLRNGWGSCWYLSLTSFQAPAVGAPLPKCGKKGENGRESTTQRDQVAGTLIRGACSFPSLSPSAHATPAPAGAPQGLSPCP